MKIDKTAKTFISLIFFFLFALSSNNANAEEYDCNNQHPDWLFCDDFERNDLRDTSNNFDWCYNWSSSNDTCVSDYYPTCSSSQDCADISGTQSYSGSKAMRLWYPAGKTGSQAKAHLGFADIGIPQLETIYVRYYRMFQQGWEWNDAQLREMHNVRIYAGHTVPGSMTDNDLIIYQEHHVGPGEDHYGEITVKSNLQSGLYLPYPSEKYSQNSYHAFINQKDIEFIPGKWHEVQFMVKLNTFNNGEPVPDGEIKLWIDGEISLAIGSLILRDASHQDIKFNHLFFSQNYPPSGPSQPQESYVDKIVISKTYISDKSDYVAPNPPTLQP